MTNIYTGRSDMELRELLVGDYRFFKNNLVNYAPGVLGNIGDGPLNEDIFANTPVSPWQAKVTGVPCLTVETGVESLGFPTNLDNYLGEDTAFTAEFVSWPQTRSDAAAYLAFLGETNATDPYVGIGINNRVYIDFGAGQQISDLLEWWKRDSPLHFVVTREAGDDPDFSIYCNGAVVSWASVATIPAGNNGFTDALGRVYNHQDAQGNTFPCWGHHLMFRVWSDELVLSEVRYLFQRVQRMLPIDEWIIPTWQDA